MCECVSVSVRARAYDAARLVDGLDGVLVHVLARGRHVLDAREQLLLIVVVSIACDVDYGRHDLDAVAEVDLRLHLVRLRCRHANTSGRSSEFRAPRERNGYEYNEYSGVQLDTVETCPLEC